jgi:RNase P subunit RPR2
MATEEMLVDLESLGIRQSRTNELNKQEVSNLIENIKQGYLKEYQVVSRRVKIKVVKEGKREAMRQPKTPLLTRIFNRSYTILIL